MCWHFIEVGHRNLFSWCCALRGVRIQELVYTSASRFCIWKSKAEIRLHGNVMEVYRGYLLVFVCKGTDRFPFLSDVVRYALGRIPMPTRSMWLLQLVSTRNKNRFPSIFRGYIWADRSSWTLPEPNVLHADLGVTILRHSSWNFSWSSPKSTIPADSSSIW